MATFLDADDLRNQILSFSLDHCERGSQGYSRVLLQLFGPAGNGKSSLINSCYYTLSEREYVTHAKTGIDYGGMTKIRTLYNLTHTIAIVDNRGFPRLKTMEMGEIFAQLANFVPLNRRVVWPNNFEEMMTKLEQGDPNFSDFIVPVYVHMAPRELPEEELENVKIFIKTCRNMTGVVPIIVLTHVTEGNVHKMERLFQRLGASEIYKLENYIAEDHYRDRAKDEEILKFLYSAIQNVKFRLDARQERVERKEFLLKYFHDQDMARRAEKMALASQELRRLMNDI